MGEQVGGVKICIYIVLSVVFVCIDLLVFFCKTRNIM